MAAPYSRILVSVRGSCLDSLKTFWRKPSVIKPSIPQDAKSLHTKSALRTKSEPQDPIHGEPEYIPQRKANNPMKKVGIAWAIGFPSGILLFLLAKREVDKKRLEQLKVRQRMKDANTGEYERSRYKTT
ncbi:uncharacterized protein O3C94_019311 [Discoglossus pictus]